MFFGVVAHEKLFDFKAASIPPRDADEECVRAGAAGEAGGFGVEKKPFGRIFGEFRRVVAGAKRRGKQDRKRACKRQTFFGFCVPAADGEMFAAAIVADFGSKQIGKHGPFGRDVATGMRALALVLDGAPARAAGGAQRGELRQFFVEQFAHEGNLAATPDFVWPRRSRIASAASLDFSPFSPAGPTQEGQPDSHSQLSIRARVRARSRSQARNSGSENPMPPG